MLKIKGSEKVEQVLGRWSPSDLAVIEALELKSHQESTGSELLVSALFQKRAEIWPDFGGPMFRVVIAFESVINLSLKGFGGGMVQVMGFDINFVGDRGMEGLKFQVEDYEDGRIAFGCGEITVRSIELVR